MLDKLAHLNDDVIRDLQTLVKDGQPLGRELEGIGSLSHDLANFAVLGETQRQSLAFEANGGR